MFNFLSVKVELGILPVDYGVDGGMEEREQFGHLREVEECGAELERKNVKIVNLSKMDNVPLICCQSYFFFQKHQCWKFDSYLV